MKWSLQNCVCKTRQLSEFVEIRWPVIMMTSSNGNSFRVTGHLCGNSPVTIEFPTQRPVTQSFDVFFDLHLNKRLSKQSWGWWFETPSRPLWRHNNDCMNYSKARFPSKWGSVNCRRIVNCTAMSPCLLMMAIVTFLVQGLCYLPR